MHHPPERPSEDPECLLVAGGTLVTALAGGEVVPGGAVLVEDGRVVFAGPEEEAGALVRGARRLDARGGLILPGFVNLHHHFYSALARGLDPGGPTRSFGEVLTRLWWRLDRALDEEVVRVSALLTLADCVRHGATTVFDHHASPSCVGGSLDAIATAVGEAGVSAVLGYEVTDRNGPLEARAGIEENLRFLEARRSDPRVRGLSALHASFTLRDETLAQVARLLPEGAGVHVHAAEAEADVALSRELFGAGPVERLERFGLLRPATLLAHGVHLDGEALDTVARSGATLVHNPESNANNGVGRLDLPGAAARGVRIGLGTDGMSSSMLRALRAAFLALRGGERNPALGFDLLPGILSTNAAVAAAAFGEPLLGRLVPGAPADLAVVDAPPPTPLSGENLFGHLVYGASEAVVRHTVARGRVLMEDFALTTLDPGDLARRAREAAPDAWRRFAALDLTPLENASKWTTNRSSDARAR